MSETNNLYKKQLSEFITVIRRFKQMEIEPYPESLLIHVIKYALTLFDPLKNDSEHQGKIAIIKAHWQSRMSEMTPDREPSFDKSNYFLMITTFEEAPGPGFSREIEILKDEKEREYYEEMLRSNVDPSAPEEEDEFGDAGGGNYSTELYTYSEMFFEVLSNFTEKDCDYQLLSQAPFIYEMPDEPCFLDFLLSSYY